MDRMGTGVCCDVADLDVLDAACAFPLLRCAYRTPPLVPGGRPTPERAIPDQMHFQSWHEEWNMHVLSRDWTDKTTDDKETNHGARAGQIGREGKTCTYPGDSVVMMGFSPSFFRFLFIAELPFEADAPAAAAGGCAGASFALFKPFMLAMWKKRDVGVGGAGRYVEARTVERRCKFEPATTGGGGAERAVLEYLSVLLASRSSALGEAGQCDLEAGRGRGKMSTGRLLLTRKPASRLMASLLVAHGGRRGTRRGCGSIRWRVEADDRIGRTNLW
ncbi:hypothetical protein B0T18DRAFT_98807 [Schizothecium vesticola]|uniref:Uncharacterized protein n=1 Tax=Schizothecium vesticola TaxID=314040 RepID=A0AA40K7T3_9PEZI|nr:hypothetical protein B0T18DRAFT_98807 [Schizothecium vesticola]